MPMSKHEIKQMLTSILHFKVYYISGYTDIKQASLLYMEKMKICKINKQKNNMEG